MRGDETPGRIVTNVCTDVGVHDVITCADLYDYRLRGLGVVGGQILGFSIDLLRRPYNTLALPCECVMLQHLPSRCYHHTLSDELANQVNDQANDISLAKGLRRRGAS